MARAAKKPSVWLPTEGDDVWVLCKVTRTAPDDEGLLDQVTVQLPNGVKATFRWDADWVRPVDGAFLSP